MPPFPSIRVELEVRAEADADAVLREGESLTHFIEGAVVAAAAWRRVQADFVNRGEAAIERWKQEGGGRTVDEVMTSLQGRLDDAKRRACPYRPCCYTGPQSAKTGAWFLRIPRTLLREGPLRQ